jgi:hypothetical protein
MRTLERLHVEVAAITFNVGLESPQHDVIRDLSEDEFSLVIDLRASKYPKIGLEIEIDAGQFYTNAVNVKS